VCMSVCLCLRDNRRVREQLLSKSKRQTKLLRTSSTLSPAVPLPLPPPPPVQPAGHLQAAILSVVVRRLLQLRMLIECRLLVVLFCFICVRGMRV